jgi:hypothetical protein
MRGRSLGVIVGFGAAILALRPIGPVQTLLGLALLPARVVAPIGGLSVPFAGAFDEASDEKSAAHEVELSLSLERAILRSAWPQDRRIPAGSVPIPGEVDARQGIKHDHIMVRVEDASRIRVGHPVVAGDVYVGRVVRIPFRQPFTDRPGMAERLVRRLGLSSPPPRPPKNVVEVALITGAPERVGALVPMDQDNLPCRLVVGGLAPRKDRLMLAMHNPESRATRSGEVVVQEPFGRIDGFDSLAEGFLIGELVQETYQPEGQPRPRTIRGVLPPVDFQSGLNQVLVLTDAAEGRRGGASATPPGRAGAGAKAVPVLQGSRWLPVRLFGFGDTSPWRSTGRLNLGKRSGLRRGAAVITGVRLVGRIARLEPSGSTVSFLGDRGFEVDVLAQAVADPDGEPLVLGRIRSVGRVGDVLRFRWKPQGSSLRAEWCARYTKKDAGGTADPAASVDVRLWTGSGLVGTPRGLLVGRTELPVELQEGATELDLDLTETGSAGEDLFVHLRTVARATAEAAKGAGQ